MDDFLICPFTVLIDTREQAAFDFRNIHADANKGNKPVIVRTERRGLATGDYAIKGLEHRCAVERKSLEDLFGCMGRDRDRFFDQLGRLNDLESGFLVIEGDLSRIRRGVAESSLLPKVVFRTMVGAQVERFPNVHWWACPGKGFAETITFRILSRFWKKTETERSNGTEVSR